MVGGRLLIGYWLSLIAEDCHGERQERQFEVTEIDRF